MDNLEVERIAGACGAIVRGLDVAAPLAAEQVEALKKVLDEHLVVVLPEQAMGLDRLEAFTDEFGGRDVTPYVKPVDGRPFVIRVIKEPGDELNFANAWHTDLSYLERPPAYTVLHAWQVPAFGGDTMWANQYRAFDTLPADLQTRLLDMQCTHSAGMAYGTGGYLEQVAHKSSMTVEPSQAAHDVQVHPAVICHPRTGRAALFVNPVYTTGFVGLAEAESRALLGRVTQHAVHPNFTCRVRWAPHQLVIWDNFATQHFAINDYAGQRREMFRTSVRGTTPTAA